MKEERKFSFASIDSECHVPRVRRNYQVAIYPPGHRDLLGEQYSDRYCLKLYDNILRLFIIPFIIVNRDIHD